jgi:hypothetical protein
MPCPKAGLLCCSLPASNFQYAMALAQRSMMRPTRSGLISLSHCLEKLKTQQ